MATSGGPKVIHGNDLVLALDAAAIKSTSRNFQSSNILPDAGNWTTGNGGQTGYGQNGSTAEQNRLVVNDDPWGRSSVTWRTVPGSSSDADGGWNTSYYTVDPTYAYRFSVWVRRYTDGQTGGTFYLGLSLSGGGNPIRNDNDTAQGNPYWHYTAISNLVYDQWYLVVAHIMPIGYGGGKHKDSGWYLPNGKRQTGSWTTSGNCGTEDLRFPSGTTTARHRCYHYYCTNTSAGIEFAAPRIDKLDKKAPTVRQLIKKGESGWRDIKSKQNYSIPNGLPFVNYDKKSGFDFDGTNDSLSLGTEEPFTLSKKTATWEAVVKFDSTNDNDAIITRWENSNAETWWFGRYSSNRVHLALRLPGYYAYYSNSSMTDNTKYYHIVAVLNGTSPKFFIDGELDATRTVNSGAWTASSANSHATRLGAQNGGGANLHNGEINVVKLYDRALTDDEVKQNFNSIKKRFDI